MKALLFALVAAAMVAGCQSEAPATENAPEPAPVTTETSATTEAPAAATEAPTTDAEATPASGEAVTVGMTMADVKKAKGTPKDTRHEHGPSGSEIDFWVYEDQTVKFQDGKVVE